MTSTHLIFIGAICFFCIKLPISNPSIEIACLITMTAFGIYNIKVLDKKILWDIVSIVVFTVIFTMFSDYSFFETLAYIVLILSYFVKIILKLKENKSSTESDK